MARYIHHCITLLHLSRNLHATLLACLFASSPLLAHLIHPAAGCTLPVFHRFIHIRKHATLLQAAPESKRPRHKGRDAIEGR